MSVTQRENWGVPDPESPTSPRFGRYPSSPTDSFRWYVAAGAAFVAGTVSWVVSGSLIDDSYITLSYARNVATHFQWGMFPEEVANAATSPLNVLLLASATWLLGFLIGVQPVAALAVVFVVSQVVLVDQSRRAAVASRLPGFVGVLAAAIVGFNPLLLSSVGLEMTLASALLATMLAATVRQRPVPFGVVAGLLVLTRVDLGVFAVVLFLGSPALWRRWRRLFASAMAVATPWFAFSWLILGSAVPDTLLIKQLQDYWGDLVFSNGLALYLTKYPGATVLSLLAPALALPVLLVWSLRRVMRRSDAANAGPSVLMGLAGLAHYLAYTTLGVPPYHWYYAPSIIGLSISAAFVLSALGSAARPVFAVIGASILFAQVVFLAQHHVPWTEAPITTNGATPAEYQRMGTELGRLVGESTVSSPGEIGALAFYCRCAIVDVFSDRGYLPTKIEERKAEVGPVLRWLIELNYTHFERDERPRPIQYDLRRVDGIGPDPLWRGDSAYHLPAHFVLERR